MPILTKAQLEALNQSSFPDNTTGAITPQILRDYNTSTIDTLVDSLDTGSFTTDAEFNTFTSSVDAKFATIGTQSGSWGGGGTINTGSFATTGSNIFIGDQTIQSDGPLNGIFYKTGSSEFFVGQRSNGNFSISSSAESRILDINPSSGWLEVYSPQTNFNNNVSFRGTIDTRNINTTTGLGFVAQFDNFTASLQEGYAWVGKSGGTSVSVPTASFAGATPVGTATTGSNNFNGNQTITGSLSVSGSEYINGGNKLYIQRDTQGAQQYLRLGATDNTYNFAFIVTGSDTNPGQQVWGINTAGGVWGNSFDAGVVFNSYVTASQGINISNGTFSAPLQQGYVWVGNASGRTTTVPTSSFGGGGSTFPYTGDAQFTGSISQRNGNSSFQGNLNVSGAYVSINSPGGNGLSITGSGLYSQGTIISENNIRIHNEFGGLTIAKNQQNSGSSYSNVNIVVDTTTDPTNVFSGVGVSEQDTNRNLTLALNSYAYQYPNITVPSIIGFYNNVDGSDLAMAFPTNGQMDVWKKSNFKYGIDVTGSVNATGGITGSIRATNGVISGSSQISGLGYALTGSNNTFTARQNINNNGGYALRVSGSITQDGSGPGNTFASSTTFNADTTNNGTLTANGNVNFNNGNVNFNNGLIANNSNVNIYGGGIGISANAQGSGSAYANATATVDVTTDPTNVYSSWQLVDETGNALIAIAVNSYSPQYATATPQLFGGGNNPDGNNAGLGFTANGQMDVWKKSNFKYGADVTGSLTIKSGSGDLYVHGHKQFNCGGFQTNITQSGSAAVSQSVNFEITDLSYGVSVASNSRITIANAGTYLITFSAQLLADAGADTVWMWLKKNGTNVAESASKLKLANNEEALMTVNFVVDAAANDYYEIAWQSTNGDAVLYAEAASGNIPAIPSVILTVTQTR